MFAFEFYTIMNNKVLMFAGAALCPAAVFAQGDRPNVVLINLDDAGNGDFSFSGALGYATPNIDSLAAGGMRMTDFYAAQPISGASRAGLLTGCYPNRIGFAYAPNPGSLSGISAEEETLAELLKERGYATAIFGKWHLGDALKFLPLQHGFDEYYGIPYSHDMWPFHPQYRFPDLPLIEGNDVIGYNPDISCLTSDYTEHSVDFIRRQSAAGKPFFLYLAHSMPHVPLAVSERFKGKSEQGLYGDVMMEIDWSVGEVMRALAEAGIEDNTLIILTSDNGPWANYGNHAGSSGGLREAKATTFGGGVRVPCIFRWKDRIRAGAVCNHLMSNIDILPTVVSITGAKMPGRRIDGLDMTPELFETCSVPVRKSLCLYYHRNSLEAVTDGSWKLVFPHEYVSYEVYAPGNDGMPGRLADCRVIANELYDLRRDPGERVNVIGLYPEVAGRLMRIADECRADLGDDLTDMEGTGRRVPGHLDVPEEDKPLPCYVEVPCPAESKAPQGGGFRLDRDVCIVVDRDCPAGTAAGMLSGCIGEVCGYHVPVVRKSGAVTDVIRFRMDRSLPEEGFSVRVCEDSVYIACADEAGAFYGAQILMHSLSMQRGRAYILPALDIRDWPEMRYRGAMLDVSRHFFTVDQVKHFIDMLAMHRLNRFHWHLTDDQGWRIEIMSYPELTGTGAWRKDGTGGFYTRKQIREIVEYASERCIEIIPEIDLPGHVSAALAARPSLGCTGGPYEVSMDRGGVHEDVLCLGRQETWTFVKDVLREVADLFPSEYVHIGGDEVPRDRWRECPYCQKTIAAYGLKEGAEGLSAEDLLQGEFNRRAAAYLKTLGKKMIGWDEVLADNIDPGTVIMSWRGLDKGMKALAAGHPVIFSSTGHFYFNNYQAEDMASEPSATGGFLPMKKVYMADLFSQELAKAKGSLVLGAEACLWTSFVEDQDDIDYQMLPRLAAFSELVWSGSRRPGYDSFLMRLPDMLKLYKASGYGFAPHYFTVDASYFIDMSRRCLEISLSSVPGSEIRYTLDGSEPDRNSMLYSGPVPVSETSSLKAVAFVRSGLRSDVFRQDIDVNLATFCKVTLETAPEPRYAGQDGSVLTDGIHSRPFHTTGLWAGYLTHPMVAVVDLGGSKSVRNVSLSSLVDMSSYIMGIRTVEIFVSEDGVSYEKAASSGFEAPDAKMEGKNVVDISLDFKPVDCRYVKVVAEGFDTLPEGHSGAGEEPFLFVDEIQIR